MSFLDIKFSISKLLTNTAPFSMSGTTMGMKPCRSQKENSGLALLYKFADFISNISKYTRTRRCSVSRAKFCSAVWSLAPAPLR